MHSDFKKHYALYEAGSSGKIRSLRDPTVKMSKSAESEQSRIELTDSNDEIWRKIRRSVTDCTSKVTYDPDNRPGVSNLIEVSLEFYLVNILVSLDGCIELKIAGGLGLDSRAFKSDTVSPTAR